jgi:EcsC protein family
MSSKKAEENNWLTRIVDWMIDNSIGDVTIYVRKLRDQNRGISNDDLAWKILHRKTLKNGLIGAATSTGGFITLPVAIPVDLIASWKIQVFMAMSIANVYGLEPDNSDLRTDVYLILAGDSAKEILKQMGIEISKSVTKKAIQKYVTREIMKKIWKVVPQKIITKAGQKSMTSLVRMVPLVGMPVGFAFDYFAARTVGTTAIHYYSGRG